MTPQEALNIMKIYKGHVDKHQERIKQSEDIIQRAYKASYNFMAKHEDMEWPDQSQLDELMELFQEIDEADSSVRRKRESIQ